MPDSTAAAPAPSETSAPASPTPPASGTETPSLLAPSAEVEVFKSEGFAFPEGFAVSDEDRTFLDGLAKDHSLPKAAMQELLAHHAKQVTSLRDEIQKTNDTAWDTQIQKWQDETKSHYGANLDGAIKASDRVLREFGTPELRGQLVAAGLGNSLAMFRFLGRIAEAFGEPKAIVSSGQPPTKSRETLNAERYPSMAAVFKE